VAEGAVQFLMPELTRRPYPEARDECWHVYFGDVHAGTLAKRTGNPHDTDPWEWRCGFYPGSRPGGCRGGTANSLDEARAGFEEAWKVFPSNRTEADFQAWRDQRDWTARKYALWDAGKRLDRKRCDDQCQLPARQSRRSSRHPVSISDVEMGCGAGVVSRPA
jgi:hypothetical protein